MFLSTINIPALRRRPAALSNDAPRSPEANGLAEHKRRYAGVFLYATCLSLRLGFLVRSLRRGGAGFVSSCGGVSSCDCFYDLSVALRPFPSCQPFCTRHLQHGKPFVYGLFSDVAKLTHYGNLGQGVFCAAAVSCAGVHLKTTFKGLAMLRVYSGKKRHSPHMIKSSGRQSL